jgi:enoyl-CoA hydratase/carnithine racemase
MVDVSGTGHGCFRIVTLSSGQRNLLNPANMSDLLDALQAADRAPEVSGVILTGAGTVFCGGLDVPAIQAGADPVEFAEALVALLRYLPTMSTPIVAAVNGDAVASGVSLVCGCDFATATSRARLGTYEVSVGIWPMIAQVPLIHRIGARAAMENIGSGEPFTAERARQLGIVQQVVDNDEEVLPAAIGWLEKAQRAGAAATTGRPSVYALAEMTYSAALDAALEKFTAQFSDPR